MRTSHVHVEKKKPEPAAQESMSNKRERGDPFRDSNFAPPLSPNELSKADKIHRCLQNLLKEGKEIQLEADTKHAYLFSIVPQRFYLCLDFDHWIWDQLVVDLTLKVEEKHFFFRAGILSELEDTSSTLYLKVEYVPVFGRESCPLVVREATRHAPGKKAKVAEPDSVMVMQQAVQELKAEMEPRVKAALVAKWEPIITRDLLQRSQSDLDRKRIEVEGRLKEIQVAQALNLFPPNQEELANIIDQDN
jgi:hypothetical protein